MILDKLNYNNCCGSDKCAAKKKIIAAIVVPVVIVSLSIILIAIYVRYKIKKNEKLAHQE